jgi:hypothetical protein
MIARAAMGAQPDAAAISGSRTLDEGDKMGIKPFSLGKGGFEDAMLIKKSCGC